MERHNYEVAISNFNRIGAVVAELLYREPGGHEAIFGNEYKKTIRDTEIET
jgi:hypothetical protein